MTLSTKYLLHQFLLYCWVLAKFTTNCSCSLISVALPTFGFLGKNLLFSGCPIHLRLKSRQGACLLKDNFSKPAVISADCSIILSATAWQCSNLLNCSSVKELWKATEQYSRAVLMNCLLLWTNFFC